VQTPVGDDITTSASFGPEPFWLVTAKVYSDPCEADVVMSSPTPVSWGLRPLKAHESRLGHVFNRLRRGGEVTFAPDNKQQWRPRACDVKPGKL